MHVGGLFIAFMSGNSTRLAVALANDSLGQAGVAQAGVACGVLLLFAAGATAVLALLSRKLWPHKDLSKWMSGNR